MFALWRITYTSSRQIIKGISEEFFINMSEIFYARVAKGNNIEY
jgi:hypothetical protein